jgi:excisionase family DNA binding protein
LLKTQISTDVAQLVIVLASQLVWRLSKFAFLGAVYFGSRTFYFERRRICSMEFMGTKEAAEKLNVKPSTVSAWCREGRIPNAEQDAKGSPWRIPANFTRQDLLPKQNNR